MRCRPGRGRRLATAVTRGCAASRPCTRPPRRWRSGGQCRLLNPIRAEWGSVSPCGVVKWFDLGRGIGLISQEGAGPDIRAEASAIHGRDGDLRQGEEVLFDLILDSAGLRADNIHRARRVLRTQVSGITYGGRGAAEADPWEWTP
ncbi:cold-shock protein [Streptomyces goshikiensis]|uniref:cold-shock protein n=1 Tax=Streptomyces goshikiensis TaxID=1942 RepID=UPI0033A0C035